MLTAINLVVLALNVVVWALVAIFGDYFKSYGTEKGKTFATMEDLEKYVEKARRESAGTKEGEIAAIQNKLDTVVEQNRAIVLSSEEIRRQISSRQGCGN